MVQSSGSPAQSYNRAEEQMDNLLDQLSVFLESDDAARPEEEPVPTPSNLVPFPQPTSQSEVVPQPQNVPPHPQDVPPQPPSLVNLEWVPEPSSTLQIADETADIETDAAMALTPDKAVAFEQSIADLLKLLAPTGRRETTLNALQQLITLLGGEPISTAPVMALTQNLDRLSTQQQGLRSQLDRLAARIEQISQVTAHHQTLLANVQPERLQTDGSQPEGLQPDNLQNVSNNNDSSTVEPTPTLSPQSQPTAAAPASSELWETQPTHPQSAIPQSATPKSATPNWVPSQSSAAASPTPAATIADPIILPSPDAEAMAAKVALATSTQETADIVSINNTPGLSLAAGQTTTDANPLPDNRELSTPEPIAPESIVPKSQRSEPLESSSEPPAKTVDEFVGTDFEMTGLDTTGLDSTSTLRESTATVAIAPDKPKLSAAIGSRPDAMPELPPISPAASFAKPTQTAVSNGEHDSANPDPPVNLESPAAYSTFQTVNPELASEFEFVSTRTSSAAVYPVRRSSRLRRRWLALGLGSLALVGIPWGIHRWFVHPQRVLETQLVHAFAADPQLAIYRLDAIVEHNRVELSGILPSRQLREHAKDVVQELAPTLTLQDQTIVLDGTVTQAVQQLSQTLNQMTGIELEATFAEGTVTLTGSTIYPGSLADLTTAFAQLPGVEQVENQIQFQPLSIATRIYFGQNTTQLRASDEGAKIQPLVALLKENPQLQIRIVGYGHRSENNPAAIARARAQAIQTRLEDQGIDRRRLQLASQTQNPPGMAKGSDRWLGRCVLFEVIEPGS
ncbi:MAG: BON domain-containing protein [Cyanobacteria bacterium P01_G01_bin.54]